MSRFIPEHPKKGSPEAYVWAERMRLAREKKKRLAHSIREAGRKTEQEFFGPGGPLEVKALKKHKLNPGKKWHEGMAAVAGRYRKDAPTDTEKYIYAGMEQAHKDSASAAGKLGMNPTGKSKWEVYRERDGKVMVTDYNTASKYAGKAGYEVCMAGHYKKRRTKKNPIAIYNPASPAGTIYNNAIEIRAQKTGGPLKGHYKHVFGKNVRIIGLTDGTVLLQHRDGKPLWITRKDYERSGRKH